MADGEKLAALRKRLQELAKESGYEHLIPEGTAAQWAERLLAELEPAETQPAVESSTVEPSKDVEWQDAEPSQEPVPAPA